jgi:hypothetical protein
MYLQGHMFLKGHICLKGHMCLRQTLNSFIFKNYYIGISDKDNTISKGWTIIHETYICKSFLESCFTPYYMMATIRFAQVSLDSSF